MKRYILFLAISVLALASCSKEENMPAQGDKSGIAIDIVCSNVSPITKAGISGTKPGQDTYNENAIRTIDYFFYPDGKTNENAVLRGRETVTSTGQYTVNVPIDEAMLNTILFPRPINTCQVAVVINYPSEITGNTTLDDIKSLPLTGDFKESLTQSKFVMFGTSEVELISRKAVLVANPVVDVHRVASKITLDAHIANSTVMPVKLIDGGVEYTLNQTWVPMTDQMYLYLENGNRKGVVGGDPVVTKPYEFFKYSERSFTGSMAFHDIYRDVYSDDDPPVYIRTDVISEQFHVSHPYYTYPMVWDTGDPKEPFLKLVLPWARLAGDDGHGHSWGTTQRSFYYRVLLPNHETGFVSNNWYHINLDVAILGADNDDASVEINGKYYVVAWGDSDPVQADIKGARYLSVSQLYHYMYNTTELKIPYVTSNPCSIQNVVVTQYDFKNRTTKTYSGSAVAGWVTLDDNNNIVINHNLNNDITTNDFDVAPYIFTFRIRHSDAEGNTYYKDITVEQYPAMYIEQARSNGYAFVKGTGNRSGSGILWDDQGQPGTINTTNVTRAIGSLVQYSEVNGTGDNNNQYQYTIHVTVLPEGSTSSIGDPRVTTGVSGSATGSPVYRLNNLTNYKPTAENTQDIIAPVFKIASSYGKTQSMTYAGAMKRCASYQENGYPAGRWRLPTMAEIEYLVTLSQKDKIPTLFGSDNYVGYWAAGGVFYNAYSSSFITPPANPTNAGSGAPYYTMGGINYRGFTRCVYDVWYWGDEQDSAHLTSWGNYQTTDPS
ncbi:MAG: hypothetical protein J6Y40_04160 [Bacteroidales bacterium]|nr:hypothetical protein [Bacteroidales bacterium]